MFVYTYNNIIKITICKVLIINKCLLLITIFQQIYLSIFYKYSFYEISGIIFILLKKENYDSMVKDKHLRNLIMISLVLLILLLMTKLKDLFSPIIEILNIIIVPIIISIFLYYMIRPIIRRLEGERYIGTDDCIRITWSHLIDRDILSLWRNCSKESI